MIKILYNVSSESEIKLGVTVNGNYVGVTATDPGYEANGADAIEALEPYNSYAFIYLKNAVSKVNHKPRRTDYKFLNLCRLGTAMKMDYALMIDLYSQATVGQVDTGMVTDADADIVIRLFRGKPENIKIDCDRNYEFLPFDTKKQIPYNHPRMTLWDSYSLTANGKEVKADFRGHQIDGPFDEPLVPENGKIQFTVTKYKGDFSGGEKLARDIDNEEVFVDCSVGVVDNRRVRLANGVGTFKLYTFGYTGPVKIKLGRKWYNPWNDYALIIGGGDD